MQLAHEALQNHPVNQQRVAEGLPPANIALPRGVGTAVDLEPFEQKYGLAGRDDRGGGPRARPGRVPGHGRRRCPGSHRRPGHRRDRHRRGVVEALEDHDFVLANIKAPDLGGHDGDAAKKMAAIAKVDNAIGYLLEHLDFEHTVIMVTGDHCTPVSFMDHTGDAIPAVFYGCGVRPDEVETFGERACMRGGLGNFTGADIMTLLTNFAEYRRSSAHDAMASVGSVRTMGCGGAAGCRPARPPTTVARDPASAPV